MVHFVYKKLRFYLLWCAYPISYICCAYYDALNLLMMNVVPMMHLALGYECCAYYGAHSLFMIVLPTRVHFTY